MRLSYPLGLLLLVGVEREGHGHLGGGDHVHGHAVPLKHIEYFGEETVLAKHARGHEIQQDLVLFCGDRSDQVVLVAVGKAADHRACRTNSVLVLQNRGCEAGAAARW